MEICLFFLNGQMMKFLVYIFILKKYHKFYKYLKLINRIMGLN